MPTPQDIFHQIDTIIPELIEIGLSDDQKRPTKNQIGHNDTEISFSGSSNISVALKNKSYTDIYNILKENKAYLIKMVDGALIQMMYHFKNDILDRHRLAFFPSPHLEEFQNSPTIYLEDEIFADIVAKNIVPFPIRFDYNSNEQHHTPLNHPKSHLTLGQYKNCRIPVSAPLLPNHFIDFILRNFYNTAHNRYWGRFMLSNTNTFDHSIIDEERTIIHIQIP